MNFPARDLSNQFISRSYQDVVQQFLDTGSLLYLLDGYGNVIFQIPSASYGQQVLTQDQSASFALQAISASYARTASYVAGLVQSASYSITASYSISSTLANVALLAEQSLSASLAQTASTAVSSSYAANATSAQTSISASYSTTASYANNASNAVSSSFALSASFSPGSISSSFSSTASYAITASYANNSSNSVSASFALSASFSPGSISSSFATTASYALAALASQTATTASFAVSASYAPFPATASVSTTASYAFTASVAVTAIAATSASYSSTASYVGDGTNNYFPLWRNNTLSSTSSIYQSASNVGIGTTSPTRKLEVNANGAAYDGTMYPAIFAVGNGSNGVKIGTGPNSNGEIQLGASNPLTINATTGLSSAGFVTYTAFGSIFQGGAVQSVPLSVSGTVGQTGNVFEVRGALGAPHLIISASGNVGLGTSSPSAVLHVQGNISASSVTASLMGTSSVAVTASYVSSASFSTSSSYALTASFVDYSTVVVNATNNATTSIVSIPNTIYNSMFVNYVLTDTQNFRAGNIVVLYTTASALLTEFCTTDIGNSNGIQFSASISQSFVNLSAVNSNGNTYSVKYHLNVL